MHSCWKKREIHSAYLLKISLNVLLTDFYKLVNRQQKRLLFEVGEMKLA